MVSSDCVSDNEMAEMEANPFMRARDDSSCFTDEDLILKPPGSPLTCLTRPKGEILHYAENKWLFEDEARGVEPADSAFIERVYCQVGSKLSAPETLRGSMEVAHRFAKEADNVPKYTLTPAMLVSIAITIVGFLVMLVCLISFTESEDDDADGTEYYFVIGLVGFALVPIPAMIYVYVIPKCDFARIFLQRRLLRVEKYMKLCQISGKELPSLFREEDHGVIDYKIVGSAGDGFGFFPVQGSNIIPCNNQETVLTQDIDINIFMNSFQPKPQHLRPIPGGTGFVWLRLSNEEVENLQDPVLKQCIQSEPGEGHFLSSAQLARIAVKYFRVDHEQIKDIGDSELIEHFPALTLRTITDGPNGKQRFEVDYAFALRYPYWPPEAAEWLWRERVSPDKKTVNEIASRGCYLVHKQCGSEELAHNHACDWRLTFANAEAALFKYHQDKEALKLCFIVIKYIIKHHCKKIKHELACLRTYHLKTLFLWMAEEDSEGLDYYTIRDAHGQPNKNLSKIFLKMLDRYIEAVEEQRLDNHFIRDRNMLASSRYEDIDFSMARTFLRNVRGNPTGFIITSFEKSFINLKFVLMVAIICIVVNSAFSWAKSISDVNSEIANSNYEKANYDYEKANNDYLQLQWEHVLELVRIAGLDVSTLET